MIYLVIFRIIRNLVTNKVLDKDGVQAEGMVEIFKSFFKAHGDTEGSKKTGPRERKT